VKKHDFLLCRRHLIRLLSISSAKDRMGLLRQAIKKHWNAARLDAELQRIYGKRNKGRPPQPPKDAIALAFYLRRAVNWWLRLKDVGPGLKLPLRMKTKMEGVWKTMGRLQAELEKWRPKTAKENR